MRTRTIIEADDGTICETSEEALLIDEMLERIAAEMAALGEQPKLGHGDYLQHDRDTVLSVRNSVLDIIAETQPFLAKAAMNQARLTHHNRGFIGRLIDDGRIRGLRRAWHRFQCISAKTGKEFNQPYFAIKEDNL